MRICILSLANPFFWTGHYLRAFRQRAEVLTVGPRFDESFLVTLGMPGRADMLKQNDIVADLHSGVNLAHLLPSDWEPDLIVAISDFGRPLCPIMAAYRCPKAYISIDTWQSARDYMDAINFDFVFAAQKSFVERLRATGSRNVHWLPMACDPQVHRPVAAESRYDISFAGAVVPHVHIERVRLLNVLKHNFSVSIRERVYGDEMCRTFCEGKLAFNNCAVKDLNMRVFEALAMGRTLLTNRAPEHNGLLDLFENGKHLLVYDGEDELVELAKKYLEDEQACTAVAEAGRALVLEKHKYVDRVDTLLDIIGSEAGGFETEYSGPEITGKELADHLPAGPGVVVDLGLAAADSRLRIKAQGARAFVGVGPGTSSESGHWDDLYFWPGSGPYPEDVDVVIVQELSKCSPGVAETLAFCHHLLRAGGTLLLRMTPNDIAELGLDLEAEALNLWLRSKDFHMTSVEVINDHGPQKHPYCIVQARKRTRTIADVVEEAFSEIDIGSQDVREFVAALPEGI